MLDEPSENTSEPLTTPFSETSFTSPAAPATNSGKAENPPKRAGADERRQGVRREDHRYKILVRVACLLNSEMDLDRLLDLIIIEANNLLDTDRTSLYLVDADKKELYSKIALGIRQEIRLPLGTGLAGLVAVTGETINVEDAQHDGRAYHGVDREVGYITRNVLTMPLRNHNHTIIGVIQSINKHGKSFDESDIEILEAFASVVAVSIENATLRRDIERMFNSFVDTMASTIDARSPQTAGHSNRVAFYSQKVALELGMTPRQAQVVYLAGLLHDFGKIGVPEAVLTNPGPLSEAEWVLMRRHVVQTKEILSNMYFIGELKRIPLIAGQHHERLNGKGYPQNLTGEQIEFEAKILAVCDVYDALTVKRYYRNPLGAGEVLEYMSGLVGIEFDGTCMEGLARVVKIIGTPQNPTNDTAEQLYLQKDRNTRDYIRG
ncbi:MAG: GAF domain-containing protein [Chloroflexi bacterium]|nr:GAF domain-containing protein [Chloroflexota bacterium]OJV91903.1 MAG: hypothetical protein BGO39_14350 [Chloroflexi bacterium 54-19]